MAKEIFRGFGPLFLRQTVSWTVLLQTDLFLKTKIRRHLAISESEIIPAKILLASSCLVALVNTVVVMPLDCVKTHLEKVNSSQTYMKAVKEIYRLSGNSYSGFFTGVRLRFLLYLTNAVFVVNILERLERGWEGRQ
jgi:hypothetical protein